MCPTTDIVEVCISALCNIYSPHMLDSNRVEGKIEETQVGSSSLFHFTPPEVTGKVNIYTFSSHKKIVKLE